MQTTGHTAPIIDRQSCHVCMKYVWLALQTHPSKYMTPIIPPKPLRRASSRYHAKSDHHIRSYDAPNHRCFHRDMVVVVREIASRRRSAGKDYSEKWLTLNTEKRTKQPTNCLSYSAVIHNTG